VLDARGEPVPRQLIVVTPQDPAAGAPQPAVTGADGVADVTGLSPGRWTARCEHEGDVPFEVAFTVTAGENAPVEMRAPAGGTIEVRVENQNGDPLPDAVVALCAPEGGAVHAWGAGSSGLASRFRTDAEGRVSIRGVRAGRIVVSVEKDAAVLKKTEVDVRPGGAATVEVR
jgi:carboxypeptidase family protein